LADLLHRLLEGSAAAVPEVEAVVDADRSITYADLNDRANRLANVLVDVGVVPGDRVALHLDKSIEAVVAIYAALKAGAVYVPLDPGAPPARLAKIVGDAEPAAVLSAETKASSWPEVLGDTHVRAVVCLDAEPAERLPAAGVTVGPSAMTAAPATNPDASRISLDLAYVLYTSGSTGVPKGVKLTHRNGLAFVEWAVRQFGVGRDDRLSSHAPLHFDLSIFDLFAAAAAGAPVVLVPPRASVFPREVGRFIADQRITVWYSVPSVLAMLGRRGGLRDHPLPALRTVLFAGEVFPTKDLRQLMAQLPHVRFANLYGPTETNVCTWYDVAPIAPDDTAPIPVGQAIDDVEVLVVTDDGRRGGVGEPGELYVRGPTVMQGYWRDQARTEQSLVPHPFEPELGDRLYRTGDVVELRDDGRLRFIGRRDAQVKVRGHRIELGDVEAAVHAHPQVVECAVVAVPDEELTNRLKAFVVTSDDLSPGDLLDFCAAVVPRYMLPDVVEFVASLPKTSTGKVDRHSLRDASTGVVPAE
jgi:amino acid adenylation domain-containing protein